MGCLHGFPHVVDPVLEKALRDCLASGMQNITSENEYEAVAEFRNGTRFIFWNTNKYYAWLKRGILIFPDDTRYTWNDARPTVKTMYEFKKALENFNYSQISIENNPFNIK